MIQVLRQNSLKAIFIALLFVFSGAGNALADEMVKDQVWVKINNGDLLTFNVEIAETSRQQEVGLMDRPYMPEDSGMLFDFGSKERMRSFWMKNTLIPLDMLFLSRDGTIHHIHHMAKAQDEAMISSERPSVAVLEINGGYAQGLGINIGDKVLHPMFRNMLAP